MLGEEFPDPHVREPKSFIYLPEKKHVSLMRPGIFSVSHMLASGRPLILVVQNVPPRQTCDTPLTLPRISTRCVQQPLVLQYMAFVLYVHVGLIHH